MSIPSITGLPLRGPVIAVWVLLGINALMFVVTWIVSLTVGGNPDVCTIRIQQGGTVFPITLQPYECALRLLGWKDNLLIGFDNQYWRLITPIFLHGSIIHLAMNSFSLFIIGPDTEKIFGTRRFVAIYFLAGLAGSLLSYAFSPSPSVGASGAIFGLMGTLIVFFYRTRHLLGNLGTRQLQGLGFLLVLNLFFGFTSPGIDNLGHLGGLIGGAIAAWLLMPRYVVDQTSFTPHVVKTFEQRDWIAALALLVVLLVLAFVVPPAL